MEIKELLEAISIAASDKKATRIVSQDLTGISSLCDYQLICSGGNERQNQAICNQIEEVLRVKHGLKPLAIEGKQVGNWILMDYGSVMVHIFLESLRDYYRLENLWPKASLTEIQI